MIRGYLGAVDDLVYLYNKLGQTIYCIHGMMIDRAVFTELRVHEDSKGSLICRSKQDFNEFKLSPESINRCAFWDKRQAVAMQHRAIGID